MKKYLTLNEDLKKYFKEKICKISLDTGFTCPTRDGTKGLNGCYYCGETGSHYLNPKLTIQEQLEKRKIQLKKCYKDPLFLAYFQSFTPTYGSIEEIKALFNPVLLDKEIVGINVATRPDTLDDEKIDFLVNILKSYYHWVEVGLETSHNKTLDSIGRGHTYEDFCRTYNKLKEKGLRVCVHLILGLPNETDEMILATIDRMIQLKVDGLKLHNLHIVKNSVFEILYDQKKISLYTYSEYLNLLVKIIKKLPPEIVLHRLVGEAPEPYLIAPAWVRKKMQFLKDLDLQLT
ncbi:MAG: TIGR01212 family radical SAM protein [Candidatus Margulisiibacteriota bacterium]|jgi:hypothetical protein